MKLSAPGRASTKRMCRAARQSTGAARQLPRCDRPRKEGERRAGRAEARCVILASANTHAMGLTEILVIDDELSVADALKVILESEGFRVTVAGSGRDGIERARRGKFGLAITDLRLPDMSGLDVLRTLLAEHPHSHVILITSYGTPEILAEAHGYGAAAVLGKPFPPSEIVRLVIALLGRPGG